MNIRELELFRHLATTLHFARTSVECNITASGLTRTIQRLESEVGEPLFFRNNRSVSLTPAGKIFKEYCEETISRWTMLQNRLQNDTACAANSPSTARSPPSFPSCPGSLPSSARPTPR
jgi:LysR family transcriptional regulator, positive regulator for ilvC